MIPSQENVSIFAQIVDRMRLMDEAELKLLYMNLFKADIQKEWENVTSEMNFGETTDEEIVKVIQQNRYSKQ